MDRRVLMIGLDGYEDSFAKRLMAEGRLPRLDRIRRESARFLLDHAPKRTGLAWEHVSAALLPQTTEHWSVVDFDTDSYRVVQRQTRLPPFPAALAARTAVFDVPYFALPQAPR